MARGPDWGAGGYEHFAAVLEPAAERIVELARPEFPLTALDVGCGTGNATVLLAARGARTTGLDPSPRLLQVADARARDAGLAIDFIEGVAEEIPLPSGSVDLVVSVFGVIFSADPTGALEELLRVVRPGGRILLSAWLPRGPIHAGGQLVRELMARRQPEVAAGVGPPPHVWHEPSTYAAAVPGGLASIVVHEERLEFSSPAAELFVAEQQEHHPMWTAARRAVGDETAWAEVMEQYVDILSAASSDPSSMRVFSDYRVIEISPTLALNQL
jgi:SAM-dependent methyltransferase